MKRGDLAYFLCLATVLLAGAHTQPMFARAGDRGQTAPGLPPPVSATNAVTEKEYTKLLAEDEAAQAEVDRWIRENNKAKANGAGVSDTELNRRVRERFEPVRQAYEDFLRRHPTHPAAHLAYGNFLNERQDEAGAQAQWEKVLELDPNNAAAYNNLAGRYSETGPAKKVFEFFTKAIQLSPAEPSYYHNFADSMCVLSQHAMKYYAITEPEVYTKALSLYSNAARLDPTNFTFAWDWAQTYYSLKPFPAAAALGAWTNALKTAQAELEREQVYVHLARVKMLAGDLAAARAQLNAVTNQQLSTLKSNLTGAIEARARERSHPL